MARPVGCPAAADVVHLRRALPARTCHSDPAQAILILRLTRERSWDTAADHRCDSRFGSATCKPRARSRGCLSSHSAHGADVRCHDRIRRGALVRKSTHGDSDRPRAVVRLWVCRDRKCRRPRDARLLAWYWARMVRIEMRPAARSGSLRVGACQCLSVCCLAARLRARARSRLDQ